MNHPRNDDALNILRGCRGRVVTVQPDGLCFLGRRSTVYRSADDGASWTPVLTIPASPLRRAAGWSRLAARLLRHEVRAFFPLPDGGSVAATREGVFFSSGGERRMSPSRMDGEGLTVFPPMCLTVGPDDTVLWGEYWANRDRRAVRLFASRDRGRTFQVVRTFPAGEIKHVHNLYFDPRLGHYWVLAGDHGTEPGIGRLSADYKSFDWLVKGRQTFRAVCMFDLGDHLLYGTDSEKEPNAVIRLEKSSGRFDRVQELDGSCIYACRFGGCYALSTSVEPSEVNHSCEAGLWVSRDLDRWTRVYQARKDRWNATYLQFGSIILPRGESSRETLIFSGQALADIDGRTLVAETRV